MSEVPPPPYRIAVIGASQAGEDELVAARRLGGSLARLGAVVLCGGRGGIMEAVARGAAEEGGLTVGFLPGTDPAAANPWITLPLATGLGEVRNALVVGSSEAVVAVGGAWGTLSEIALARRAGLDVGTLGDPPAPGLGLPALEDPERAAEWAVANARRRRGDTPPSS